MLKSIRGISLYSSCTCKTKRKKVFIYIHKDFSNISIKITVLGSQNSKKEGEGEMYGKSNMEKKKRKSPKHQWLKDKERK